MSEERTEKRILFLHERDCAYEQIKDMLTGQGYCVISSSDIHEAITEILNVPPVIILVSTTAPVWEEFMHVIKGDSLYKHLPLILLTGGEMLASFLEHSSLLCDDLIIYPFRPEEVLLRLQLRETSATLNLDANPLTHLPGNFSIMAAIRKTIENKAQCALCYVDLDNFKAFNDCYGFTRGDEALRMTARIISNVVQRTAKAEGFVGHVGGDDFFFIIPARFSKECCEEIIHSFDLVIPTLMDEGDRARGYIESKDRKGNPQRFPLLSVSIAVIDLTITGINHLGEASAVAGELKKAVKKLKGSNYLINRRRIRET